MKKNLLLVAGICFAFGSYAQVGLNGLHLNTAPQTQVKDFAGFHSFNGQKGVNNDFTAKAAGDTVYSEDFTDGSAWTLDNAGQTGAKFGWALTSTSRTWYAGLDKQINSTSGGQFLEVMNGEYNNGNPTSAVGIVYTATSPAIAISGKDYTLNFQQYGALFNDGQKVQVSSDGVNWADAVYTNNNRPTFTGADPSAIYGNPENISVNLGLVDDQYLSASSTTLYIRFLFNSRFESQTSTIAWLTFGWMIDDVVITENQATDIEENQPFVSSEGIRYSIIPTAQAHAVGAINAITNNGSAELANVKSFMKITTPTTTINDTIPVGSLAAYTKDTIVHQVNLTDEGTYVVSDFGTSADDDANLSNNTNAFTYDFQYGGLIYALDRGEENRNNYDYENENAEFYVGNAFDMYADAEVTGVDFFIATAGSGANQIKSTEGTEVYVQIRNYETDFPIISQSELYSISNGDNNKWTTLVFDNPVPLTAGTTYLASVGTYGSNATEGYDLIIGYSGNSLAGSSLAYYGSETDWYRAGSGGTPMVRMNFTPGLVSTKNLNESVKVNIYPNPANETAVVDYNTAFDGNVTISVVDMNGRTIYTTQVANQAAGNNKVELNVNNFDSGVYQVVIEANSSTVTKKLIVK